MSDTSRILIEYGTSLRAVCAHSRFDTSLTHWLSSGSVTITVESVICLSYSLPICTSEEVGRAYAGAGMLALIIATLKAMTTIRRNGVMGGSSGTGADGERDLACSAKVRNSPLVTHKSVGCMWRTELSRAFRVDGAGRRSGASERRAIMITERCL